MLALLLVEVVVEVLAVAVDWVIPFKLKIRLRGLLAVFKGGCGEER